MTHMSGELTLIGVFFAGLLSFLSPCVLPLVPPYLTYLAGVSLDEMTPSPDGAVRVSPNVVRKAFVNASYFVLGFTCVFVVYFEEKLFRLGFLF